MRSEIGESNGTKPVGLLKPVTPTGLFGEPALVIERLRVSLQVRKTHLEKVARVDNETNELFRRTKAFEEYVNERMQNLVDSHPTAPWFLRISGCHRAIMGKLIWDVESFGKYYPAGDPMIPGYVTREPVEDEDKKLWVWVEGIERCMTPSKLRKYAGMIPDSKAVRGQLLSGNREFKSHLFRLSLFGFMMVKKRYYDQYVLYKNFKRIKFLADGWKILPTPKGRSCLTCEEEKKVPATTFYCPDCNTELSKKDEPEGILWEGHFDWMCRHKMIQLFLDHWWAVWREAAGLPLRVPYPMEYLGHTTLIDPWDMCDLPAPKELPKRTAVKAERAPRERKKVASGKSQTAKPEETPSESLLGPSHLD